MQTPAVTSLESTPGWSRALALAPPASLAELFATDEERVATFTVRAGDLTVDFSRQRVDSAIVDALVEAAVECGVDTMFTRMLSGEPINVTENRPVGHLALRMSIDERFHIEGIDVVPAVHENLAKMSEFAEAVRRGDICGSTGRPFVTVVNIGIGGSDLGPRLISEALRPLHHERVSCRFVANVDPEELESTLVDLDPAETLIVVSSKTFTTVETLTNARVAAEWIRDRLGENAVAKHVVAVSADPKAVQDSGIGAGIVFPLWQWVGGRYSLGSAVGLSAMIQIGSTAFSDMLGGMREIDEHVHVSSPERNASLLMALIAVWNHAVLGHPTRAIIPYAFGLRRLPAYLQQLMMESNGKSVRSDGTPVGLPTSAVIWGDTGTNAQHAFMQLLHQGTSVVPVDFIGFARTGNGRQQTDGERILFSNLVAQSQALAFGRSSHDDVGQGNEPHRVFSGNRPSTVILAPELTARTLGHIVALYEHAVFYEGVLLGIDSFDQWGVELGKEMAIHLMEPAASADVARSPGERAGRALMEWFSTNAHPSGT